MRNDGRRFRDKKTISMMWEKLVSSIEKTLLSITNIKCIGITMQEMSKLKLLHYSVMVKVLTFTPSYMILGILNLIIK